MTGKSGIHYHDYLQLKPLLNAQDLESVKAGRPAHDEMLFIIVHQTYELWFKQVLHELTSVLNIFSPDAIDESQMGQTEHRLQRINEIVKLLIQQVDVLETMTPLDFLEFRDLLYPASGFQSHQFRLVEIGLGLKTKDRLLYNNQSYLEQIPETYRDTLRKAENGHSLFDLVEKWLERTPFLENQGFDFWKSYQQAVIDMFDSDRAVVQNNPYLEDEDLKRNLQNIDRQLDTFTALFDEEKYRQLQKDGHFRLSYKGLHAALLIQLYRDQPIFQLPFRIITELQNLDSGLTTWRYRHAIMAHRMLGRKIGTGGSSGHEYLAKATEKHKVFTDFFNLSTFFIPRSKLPKIPEDFRKQLDFYYKEND